MIDFLNLKENINECGLCKKQAHSLHLLPYSFYPYVFEIGYSDYYIEKVYVLDSYGERKLIFEDYNELTSEFISLRNIKFDDINLVRLEFTLINKVSSVTKTLYSDKLLISNHNACNSKRISFKCAESDTLQTIGFNLRYLQSSRNVDLSAYYQISKKQTVTYSNANSKFDIYTTGFVNIDSIAKLSDAMQLPFVYLDYKRVNLFEAIEIPEVEGDAYFGETKVMITTLVNGDDITPSLNIVSQSNEQVITETNINIITE